MTDQNGGHDMTLARNFSIHISNEDKEALRTLAKESNMKLLQYVEQVLREAVSDQVVYGDREVEGRCEQV